jgi:hypothetical protein
MTHSFDKMLVKAFQGKNIQELLDAPPDALWGLSRADARHLEEAFGIRTIEDLARNRFFHRALAVLAASGEVKFDPGPGLDWENFFDRAPLDYYVNHPGGWFRLDFGPVYYRGRLDGSARIIVVGQDPSTNEILGHRIFVGRSGQRVQGFLKKLGITRSYAMLNTFLYSVYGQFYSQLRNISLEAPILSYRNEFLDRLANENPIQAVVAIGSGARHAMENWPGSQSLPVFPITHPAAHDEEVLLDTWNAALVDLRAIVDPDDDGVPDLTPYGDAFAPEDQVPIPRFDLPFGVPEWHGVGGGHSHRGDDAKQIIWTAP